MEHREQGANRMISSPTHRGTVEIVMTAIFITGTTIALLLALLTLISTLIGQRLPQIAAALVAGSGEAARTSASMHYAA